MPRLPRPLRIIVALAGLVALGACGADQPASAPEDCTPVTGTAYTLVGQDLAWNTDCLSVPVGRRVRFRVDLRDRGVQHDLQISGPSGKAKTPLETGPTVLFLDYRFRTAGFHQFVCSVHATMEGSIYVG